MCLLIYWVQYVPSQPLHIPIKSSFLVNVTTQQPSKISNQHFKRPTPLQHTGPFPFYLTFLLICLLATRRDVRRLWRSVASRRPCSPPPPPPPRSPPPPPSRRPPPCSRSSSKCRRGPSLDTTGTRGPRTTILLMMRTMDKVSVGTWMVWVVWVL